MSEFKSKFVKCPFYLDRQGDTHRIKCEGVKKGTSTQLTFVGKKENYLNKYCCEDYFNCKIYKMLCTKYL
jgi:hypothetical protein